MNPFHHRGFIRKRKKNNPQAPVGDFHRVGKGLPNAGAFIKRTENAGLQQRAVWVRPVDKPVDNFLSSNVVSPTLTRHNGVMKGNNEMSKSHRVTMAQALITELAEAHLRHGDTDGTRRLQAMVARMVAELLYR